MQSCYFPKDTLKCLDCSSPSTNNLSFAKLSKRSDSVPSRRCVQPAYISHQQWHEVIATKGILPHCAGQEKGGSPEDADLNIWRWSQSMTACRELLGSNSRPGTSEDDKCSVWNLTSRHATRFLQKHTRFHFSNMSTPLQGTGLENLQDVHSGEHVIFHDTSTPRTSLCSLLCLFSLKRPWTMPG